VSRRRTTFGKLQRDRDKQAKAQAKLERRAHRAEQSEQGDDDTSAPEVDQATVLAQLADLHAAFDEGKIGLEDFETRRNELTSQLRID
jgi:hypothetical protein